MKSQLFKWLKLILPIVLGILLMGWIYKKFTPEQLATIRFHFQHARYGYLGLALFFGFLSHLSRAYRWNYLLHPMGYYPKYYNNAMAVGVSFLMNMVIPRFGEVSRAWALKKYEQVPFEKSFGTIVAERLVDAAILCLCLLLTLYLQYEIIKDFLFKYAPSATFLWIAGIVILVLIAGFVYLAKSKSAWNRKINRYAAGFKEGMLIILTAPKAGWFALHTLLIWVLYFGMFYASTLALKETSVISLSAAFTGFSVGSVAIAFTNGGFAYYPIFVAQILVLFSIPYETGTAFGWLTWTSQFVMILFLGGLSFMLLPIVNRKKSTRNDKG